MHMNLIDRIVGWVSPQRGYARQAWRDALRHYDSRLNANWRAINTSAEQTDRYSRDTVRARARDLERNSDMLNGVMGAFVRNVVGGGFTLQAETGKPELNHEIEKLWAQWCKKRNCDVTGTQSLSQMLRMACCPSSSRRWRWTSWTAAPSSPAIRATVCAAALSTPPTISR